MKKKRKYKKPPPTGVELVVSTIFACIEAIFKLVFGLLAGILRI